MIKSRFFSKLLALLSVVILLVATSPAPSLAQESNPKAQRPRQVFPRDDQPDEVLKVDTDLVSLDVVANDFEGRPIRNLKQEDFKVYLDGVEQPLAFFQVERRSGEPRPLAVVFALDISGSMTSEEIERLRSALNAFSARLAAHSTLYAVMAFGMNVKVLQKFTSEADRLDRAFERISREPNGLSTHTYDAVDDAIRLLVRHAPRTRERRLMKRAVLVVTDGFPVGDTVSARTVIERANTADASIYVVTLPSYSRMLPALSQTPLPTPLDVSGLADLTGGRSVYAEENNYDALFRALAEEVTSAYVLAFYPPEPKRRDGQFHNIRVDGPAGLTLRQSRPGFQAEKSRRQ
ncbi:MAG TPA: VWA domain-containing protein [Pyrinomonadaceae bacterium]|jgi:VWFA-related protein|nr:VWA domain-containing protein [Pyrinomonadaceae bacterium]